MRERILILGALGLALSFPAARNLHRSPIRSGAQAQDPAKPDDKPSSEPAPKDDSESKPRIVPKSRSRTTPKSKSKTKSTSKGKSSAKSRLEGCPQHVAGRRLSLDRWLRAIRAARRRRATSEEKLLVYLRPLGFKTRRTGDSFEAHLIPDFEIRKRGEKAVLLHKKKYLEYHPTSPEPPGLIYLKSVISLKGLKPGDYDLRITLHDEIAKEAPATQDVKFRVIPPADPREKTADPGEKTADPGEKTKPPEFEP